jgi:hypothetical protein
MRKFLLIILILGLTVQRLIFDQNIITTIKPAFEQTVTEPTNDSVIIHFQILNNYIHEISYQLYISEFSSTLWMQKLSFYQNWKYTMSDYIANYSDSSYWSPWSIAYSGKNRIITLNTLNESKIM